MKTPTQTSAASSAKSVLTLFECCVHDVVPYIYEVFKTPHLSVTTHFFEVKIGGRWGLARVLVILQG